MICTQFWNLKFRDITRNIIQVVVKPTPQLKHMHKSNWLISPGRAIKTKHVWNHLAIQENQGVESLKKGINKFDLNLSITEKNVWGHTVHCLNPTPLVIFLHHFRGLQSTQLVHQFSNHTFAIVPLWKNIWKVIKITYNILRPVPENTPKKNKTTTNHQPHLIFTASIPIISPRQHGSFQTSILVDGLDHLQTLIKGDEVILCKMCLLPGGTRNSCDFVLFGEKQNMSWMFCGCFKNSTADLHTLKDLSSNSE